MPRPVLSIAEMRAWEAASWAAGLCEEDVIRQAGAAVATAVRRHTLPGRPVLVVAGKGHNGDDARRAAEALADRAVRLVDVRSPDDLPALEAALAAAPADVVVLDGLFGIGLGRPLDAAWVRVIRALNDTGRRVLALDVPSGLDADTGAPRGAAVCAAVTVTLGAVKHGLLAAAAAPHVGRLELAPDIGLLPWERWAAALPEQSPTARPPLEWTLDGDFRGFPPPRPADGHKGTFGHLAILAGSAGYHGAAVLAARGALRARPGLVTVLPAPDACLPVAAQLQAAMVRPWTPGWIAEGRCTAVLVGPGLVLERPEPELRAEAVRLWRGFPGPVIADASALEWLPPGPVAVPAARVLTPHPGEAARLLGTDAAAVQADRPAALRALAARFGGCLVVLKGRLTLVGAAAGPVFVNGPGNAGLAQGGTGDVLAGLLAGLLAQPAAARDPVTTARYAVWRHGRAADALEAAGAAWTTEDLAAALGALRDGE